MEQQRAALHVGDLLVDVAVLRHDGTFEDLEPRDRHLPAMNHLADDHGVHLLGRQLLPIVEFHAAYSNSVRASRARSPNPSRDRGTLWVRSAP